MRFQTDVASNLEQSLSREWLETNGLGGFASSTIAGANTRRYHGLLVAATRPPLGRAVLLSKIDETVVDKQGRHDLACNLYRGAVHPRGYEMLREFRLDPWPVWQWEVNGQRIEKSVCLLHGKNTVVVEYRLLDAAGEPVKLELRPLVAFRDYHNTTHANSSINSHVTHEEGGVSIQPYPDLPSLHFQFEQGVFTESAVWYNHFEYPRERERGLDFEEDLFQAFVIKAELHHDQPFRFVISPDHAEKAGAEELLKEERARRSARPGGTASSEIVGALERAAEQFFSARSDNTTVIAGYHWFTDWGRDTMISLPGLALATNQPEKVREVLLAFLPWMYQGLIPNRFPDAGEQPEYNATDATLWMVEALRGYAAATGDYAFIREHTYAALKDIVEWRERGTLYNIRLDSDGLLSGGAPGIQLTWMDARVGDWVVTPRDGKPVEIQALWYNALLAMAEFADRFKDDTFGHKCRDLAARARKSFAQKFWNEAEDCLYDAIDGDRRDAAVRPNQLLALSLAHPICDKDRGIQVLEAVKRELLTPFGLRTLSRRDPQYAGRCEGGPAARDGAYHQGTIWPWLLGPYVDAMFSVHGRNEHTLLQARLILDPFRHHLRDAGVGQVSEIFDGDPPYTPRGCIAQAWSVAELLRIARMLETS